MFKQALFKLASHSVLYLFVFCPKTSALHVGFFERHFPDEPEVSFINTCNTRCMNCT